MPLLFIGAGVVLAGSVMTYAYADEKPAVFDISVTAPRADSPESVSKVGLSVLIDFEREYLEIYSHSGVGHISGCALGFSVALSAGVVSQYDGPGKYAESFYDHSVSFPGGVGMDFCYNPDVPLGEACKARSITFTFDADPFPNYYTRYDYYKEKHTIHF